MNRCSLGSDSSSTIVMAEGSSNTGIASGIRTPCLRKLIPALLASSHSKLTNSVYVYFVHTSTPGAGDYMPPSHALPHPPRWCGSHAWRCQFGVVAQDGFGKFVEAVEQVFQLAV